MPHWIATGLSVGVAVAIFANPSSSVTGSPEARETRESLMARSRVWFATDIPSMDLKTGPSGPGSFTFREIVACTYVNKQLSGASPKFACRLPNGHELKVKYGGTNGEAYGEVAASRLLWALGFGADRMYSVRVICRGCPARVGGVLRRNGDRILDPAAVERKIPGEVLSDDWSWDELDDIDEAAGGARKAERDALKLLAVLLQHSDSKPEQQRVICVEGTMEANGRCRVPMMMINDLGITFGRANAFNQQPTASVNLAGWADVPVWKDSDTCIGNLSGSVTGTLKNPVISEEGRRFLADLLLQLSDQQLRDMFEAARVHLRPRAPESGRSGFPPIDEWVAAFKEKRAQIVERRCRA
jgi:hypothetical protein